MSNTLLTADDLAAMIGMSTDWIYDQVRKDRIPHVRLGRYVRFRHESIEEWICGLERGMMEPITKRGRTAGTAARMAHGGTAP